jgi:predicted membrane-bound mannosyltransferase
MKNAKLLLPFYILLTLLTIFCTPIPFFWDGTFFSALSVYFYENGMNGYIAPLPIDTGGFPLFSSYLTFAWKLFGKTLTVSHLAILPFIFGIVFEFYKLSKRFLNEKTILFALILLIIEPVFITQSILMGYDILIAYFFLLSLNSLYEKKQLLFSIALTLLCLISIRGIMLASAIFRSWNGHPAIHLYILEDN